MGLCGACADASGAAPALGSGSSSGGRCPRALSLPCHCGFGRAGGKNCRGLWRSGHGIGLSQSCPRTVGRCGGAGGEPESDTDGPFLPKAGALRPGAGAFQPAAHLSAGWWADFAQSTRTGASGPRSSGDYLLDGLCICTMRHVFLSSAGIFARCCGVPGGLDSGKQSVHRRKNPKQERKSAKFRKITCKHGLHRVQYMGNLRKEVTR